MKKRAVELLESEIRTDFQQRLEKIDASIHLCDDVAPSVSMPVDLFRSAISMTVSASES